VHNLTFDKRLKLPPSGTTPPPPPENLGVDKKDPEYPIVDRVSHVFLYNYRTDNEPRPGTFTYIGKTYLPSLVAGGAPAGGAGGGETAVGGLGGAVAASGRDTWKPLFGTGGGALTDAGTGTGPAVNTGKFGRGAGLV